MNILVFKNKAAGKFFIIVTFFHTNFAKPNELPRKMPGLPALRCNTSSEENNNRTEKTSSNLNQIQILKRKDFTLGFKRSQIFVAKKT
jgi:hypothetical protein